MSGKRRGCKPYLGKWVRKGRTINPSSRRRFSKNGNIVNFSKHLSISRNIINSETNNNQQVNKFPQIKVLLVGVCCREGFVTLPEVGCKHWEGLQTLPYLWQWDAGAYHANAIGGVINPSLLVAMRWGKGYKYFSACGNGGGRVAQTLPYSFLCSNGCLLGFLANLQAIQCV